MCNCKYNTYLCVRLQYMFWLVRARSGLGGTRWRMAGEVNGKLVNGVGSQYSHAASECGVSSITQADVHTSAASSRLNWSPHRFKWTRPFQGKTKSGFCACAITFRTSFFFTTFILIICFVAYLILADNSGYLLLGYAHPLNPLFIVFPLHFSLRNAWIFFLRDRQATARRPCEILLDFTNVNITAIVCLAPPSTVKPSLDAIYDATLAERWSALISQAGKNSLIFEPACFKTVRIG